MITLVRFQSMGARRTRGYLFAFYLWFRNVSGEAEPKLGYTHQQHAGNIHTLRSFAILPETLSHPPSLPQSSRDGKMSINPFTTTSKPGPSRVSGIWPTDKCGSMHLGSGCSSLSRGSSETFLKSSMMFVVLKWISSRRSSMQWTEIGRRQATVVAQVFLRHGDPRKRS